MQGFNFKRKDQAELRKSTLKTKRGGGVAVYLADKIKYKRRNDLRNRINLAGNQLKKHKNLF